MVLSPRMPAQRVARVGGALGPRHRNNCGANSFRYCCQLIHVWPPGVSLKTGLNPCFLNNSTDWRVWLIRKSSEPVANHSSFNPSFAGLSERADSFSFAHSSALRNRMPELNTPT